MIVTGATGLIGSRYLELLNLKADSHTLLSANNLNITNANQVLKTFEQSLTTVLHLAAVADVAGCEKQRGNLKGSAWQVNVEGTKNVVAACAKFRHKLIYFSTDFVFTGYAGPYSEDDMPADSTKDISWYGWTKLEGEKAIEAANIDYLIIRTSYPYRTNFAPKTDFVRNILAGLKNNILHPMFDDQFLTPTFIDDIVKALEVLIREKVSGIYHVVDNTTLSAYEAAVTIAKVFGFDPGQVKKSALAKFQEENPKVAPRPAKGGLKNDKLTTLLAKHGQNMLDFENALRVMKRQLP